MLISFFKIFGFPYGLWFYELCISQLEWMEHLEQLNDELTVTANNIKSVNKKKSKFLFEKEAKTDLTTYFSDRIENKIFYSIVL